MPKRITSQQTSRACWLAIMVLLLPFPGTGVWAANQVDIEFGWNIWDTLWIGMATSLDVSIENDFTLGGMQLGFRIWSPDGAEWAWHDVGGYGSTTGCVTVNPMSRFIPSGPDASFDMTGLLITEQNVDEYGYDTIMIGGVAMKNGIEPGPLEQMFSINFIPDVGAAGPEETRTLCFDSCFVPPSGPFVFVDRYGSASPPITLWPVNGLCYPVGGCRCFPPLWDPDLPMEMTVAPGVTGSVILSATDFEDNDIYFGNLQLTGGAGEAVLNDYGDGTCEVFYTAVPEDVGQEITIEVYSSDAYFPFGVTPPHAITVTVIEVELAVECGAAYISGATNNLIVKNDISVPEQSPSKAMAYSMIDGPGEIDGTTGAYSWMPGPTDIGIFTVTVSITDGFAVGECLFQVDVVDENCCPGDANFSGDVNVGDAVSLINYIFKGGLTPKVMNWADANADCQVNVGDVVFLISYVFRSGAAPVVGCYY